MNRHVTTALVCLAFAGCKSPAATPDAPVVGTLDALDVAPVDTTNIRSLETVGTPLSSLPDNAQRPRWSPTQQFLTFFAGEEGARRVFVIDGSTVRKLELGEGDFVDPDFSHDGSRIVYAAKTAETRGFDLFVVDLATGESTMLHGLPGDDREPTVNPLLFGFYGVQNGVCGSPASGVTLDGYEKVLFTNRATPDGPRAIHYTSLSVRDAAPVYPEARGDSPRPISASGTHSGSLTTEGDCHSPRFSGDGLSALWTCDAATVHDGRLEFDMDFESALKAIENDGCAVQWGEEIDWTAGCFEGLPTRYSTVATRQAYSRPGVSDASYSTNQIGIIVGGDGVAMARRSPDASFGPVDTQQPFGGPVSEVVWSPDGSRIAAQIATDSGPKLHVVPTNAYLQDVRNLVDFPELWAEQDSELLQKNRFVARQSTEKEFYVAYDKLRYERRPQFITTDTALQVFRDEFQIVLERAENRAAADLTALSRAMMKRFSAKNDAASRYLAIYFATAWVPLESAARLEQPTWDEIIQQSEAWGDPDAPTDPERPTVAQMMQPAAGRIAARKAAVLRDVPASIRDDVEANVSAMYAASGIGSLTVPGFPKKVRLDWTQFRPRGAYAQSPLAGYFYAMSWFGQAPLPFQRAPLEDLLAAMNAEVDGSTWLERWESVDALVGAFMGKPGAATLTHLAQTRRERPAAWKAWDRKALVEHLAELRGEVTLRDLDAALEGAPKAALKVMLFPKRVGLDTTFFRALVAPDVDDRFTPSPLDAFAVLGSGRAEVLALAAARTETYSERYAAALAALQKKQGELAATDIYHAWIAVLMTLASNDAAVDLLAYTQSDAWRDRLLHSALVGYTQLKHSAVLYNMQDMGVQCDGGQRIYLLTERPIIPEPRGSVDPQPEFFDALAKLAGRMYDELAQGREPTVTFWWDEDDETSARQFAEDLATISRKVKRGEALTESDYAWIRATGGRLEALLMRTPQTEMAIPASAETRIERGVAIATDIHTQVQSRQVLQIGVGRLLAMWVAVPDTLGARLTQGYLGSYYEFLHPMDDRLTDARWNEMIEANELPSRPEWTTSFIEKQPE